MSDAPIALTCGEPAGVGPEVAAKAWSALGAALPFFYMGDPRHLPAGTPIVEIGAPTEAIEASARGLPVLPVDMGPPAQPGRPDPAHAPHVVEIIARAVDFARSGAAAAVCTLPINKKALIDGANFAYPGHTEYLAALAGVDHVVMMLACDALRVVPATIHIPISEVPRVLTAASLERTIRITHDSLRTLFGIEAPRIAVAGLNPHAGEQGAMGREEVDWIFPLIERLRAEGLTLRGPSSADTMFHADARRLYDVAVAMYHDQALIPIKTIDFAGGVNVTLGLPFIRTSPDHGTAFDIAGTGAADPTSTLSALRLARRMADTRAA
ncbi:4-hydroxythreonine-4-phosphate dehydrogenase PdxA [Palleronia sp.]|uniref:4-hydroxythreonine-4-phosphate dehydrogenase PdxA n=1 Tax=Palleronia sp. TaxID=1940284 RepID=UPI0035C844C2